MSKIIALCSFIMILTTSVWSQAIGVEVQQYPTGFLFGVYGEIDLKEHHAITFRAGYNLLDHKDLGVQENEEGGGFGGSVGYKYYFSEERSKLFLGARTDLWFNSVDWTNDMLSGTTEVLVLQPTAMVGFSFLLNEHVVVAPTLALGAEINVDTDGAEVGQGGILLWGVQLGYKF